MGEVKVKEQLQEWLNEIVDYGVEPLRRLRFTEDEDASGFEGGSGFVIFCSASHTYHLSFTANYLGARASARTVRAGEDWTRGNDLPDGPFSRDTFDRIIRAIIAYELVDLEPVVEPQAVEIQT